MADRPVVFISYSHKNEKEKDQLLTHLGVLEEEGVIDLWIDTKILPGEVRKEEIRKAIAQARVAILLVSANFLSSKEILDTQVPLVLRLRESKGLIVFAVIARPCAWQGVARLAEMEVRPRDGQAIWGTANRYVVDKKLANFTREIKRRLGIPIYRKDVEALKGEGIDVISHRLTVWKKIHKTTQDLLRSISYLSESLIKYQYERTETRVLDIRVAWARYCEQKAKKIKQGFKEFEFIKDDPIKELEYMMHSEQYVPRYIDSMNTDDQNSYLKLWGLIDNLIGILREVLDLADKRIIEIAAFCVNEDEPTL